MAIQFPRKTQEPAPRSLTAPPKKGDFSTAITGTHEQANEFYKFFMRDPRDAELNNVKLLYERGMSVIETCADERAVNLANRLMEVHQKLVPESKKREDGSPTAAHEARCMVNVALAGGDVADIMGMLLHDTQEHGRITNLKDLMRKTGVSSDHEGFLGYVGWVVDGLTNTPRMVDGQKITAILKKELQSPDDFKKEKVQELERFIHSDQRSYLTNQIFSPESNFQIKGDKGFDSSDNIWTILALDPKTPKHFARVYNTLWKALDAVSKFSRTDYPQACKMMMGIELVLEQMASVGYGPHDEPTLFTADASEPNPLQRLWNQYFALRYGISDDQYRSEIGGAYKAGPREYVYDQMAHCRTTARLWGIIDAEWSKGMSGHVYKEPYTIKVEFPTRRFSPVSTVRPRYFERDFIEGPFEKLGAEGVKKIIAYYEAAGYAFKRAGESSDADHGFKIAKSLHYPVLAREFFILEFDFPPQLAKLANARSPNMKEARRMSMEGYYGAQEFEQKLLEDTSLIARSDIYKPDSMPPPREQMRLNSNKS